MPKKERPARELAARALCRFANQPEGFTFQDKPMRKSYLDEADTVIKAIGWKPGKLESNGGARQCIRLNGLTAGIKGLFKYHHDTTRRQ